MSEYKIQENKKTGMYRVVARIDDSFKWTHVYKENRVYFLDYSEADSLIDDLIDDEYHKIESNWEDRP